MKQGVQLRFSGKGGIGGLERHGHIECRAKLRTLLIIATGY
jgi:hypothetical protein